MLIPIGSALPRPLRQRVISLPDDLTIGQQFSSPCSYTDPSQCHPKLSATEHGTSKRKETKEYVKGFPNRSPYSTHKGDNGGLV